MNTLMLQDVLADDRWNDILTAEDRRGLTPLFWQHVLPYGEVKLDTSTRLTISTPDLRALLEVWHHATERELWRSVKKRAAEDGDADWITVAQQTIAENQDVSVLDGLRANERIVSLLTGWRW